MENVRVLLTPGLEHFPHLGLPLLVLGHSHLPSHILAELDHLVQTLLQVESQQLTSSFLFQAKFVSLHLELEQAGDVEPGGLPGEDGAGEVPLTERLGQDLLLREDSALGSSC